MEILLLSSFIATVQQSDTNLYNLDTISFYIRLTASPSTFMKITIIFNNNSTIYYFHIYFSQKMLVEVTVFYKYLNLEVRKELFSVAVVHLSRNNIKTYERNCGLKIRSRTW